MIRFAEILEKGRQLWPLNIDVQDGKLINDGGFISKNLINAHDRAEYLQEQKYPTEHWGDILIWAMYKTIFDAAVKKFTDGTYQVRVDEIDNWQFEVDFKAVMKESCSTEEEDQYVF